MSQRNSGYEKKDLEAYFTPAWVTHCLLDEIDFKGGVFDPCCGDGQIIKACLEAGHHADGSDIHYYGFKPGEADFLEMKELPRDCINIITNPPYGEQGKLAEAFIEKAISLVCKSGGMAAFLLRKDFDSARTRQRLFNTNSHFVAEITLLKRIQWTNLIHTASPSQNHSWFVWNSRCKGGPARKYYSHPDGIGNDSMGVEADSRQFDLEDHIEGCEA